MSVQSAFQEIVIDSFAGGGGTSEGIRQAIGRDPDIAINHDHAALAMHRINHPGTHHMVEDVWNVDALGMCAGRPVGLLWLSPDCKHFSKAKGGKPRSKDIRGLAWVGLRWVKSLPKRQRPRVIALENVEEFQDWGPLLDDGKPCPLQKGATFRSFIGGFEALGYRSEHRELRACDYGDPTIRKRLFVIMRRDGKPIVWPERTHGNPKNPKDAALIAAGKLKPWRTAAEIIDWSLPCPSIFDTSEAIKEKLGLRAIRPLADNTLTRVAKGTMRYVVNNPAPFIVRVNHGDSGGRRHRSIDEPMATNTVYGGDALVQPFLTSTNHADGTARDRPLDEPLATLTAKRGDALVMPFVSYGQHGGANRDVTDPMHTIAASEKDQNMVVTPFITKFNSGSTGHMVDEPLATVTSHASETHGGGAAPLGLVALILVGCGGRAGQSEPRPADEPVLTQTAKADACLTAVHLSTMRNSQKPFSGADEPTQTMTAGGANAAVVAAFLAQHNSERDGGVKAGSDVAEPVRTVTASGGQQTLVSAFLAQHNTDMIGHAIEEPVSTIVGKGCTQGLVAAHLTHSYTSNTRGGEGDLEKPIKTIMAGGQHAALVAAFLQKYYGNETDGIDIVEPMHTVTTKDRVGLVTVSLQGAPYVITDIGMRMLTPRERFSAQGFRPDYVIDRGILEDGSIITFTLEQQGRMCGNSVCPGMARALVGANYQPCERSVPDAVSMPLFAVAAE